MTYGVITTVEGSIDTYRRIHDAAIRRTGGVLPGLLLHIGRETKSGFQIIEVWDTKDQCEQCNREIIWPLLADIVDPTLAVEPVTEEFDPRGLVLTGGQIAR